MPGWFYDLFIDTDNTSVPVWLIVLVIATVQTSLSRVFTQLRKMQSRELQRSTLRHELLGPA